MEEKNYFMISSKFGTRILCNTEKLADLIADLKQLDTKFSVKSGPSRKGPFSTIKDVYGIS